MDNASSPSGVSARRELLSKVVASHPQEVADVVATLSWSVTSPDGLLEYLQRTVDLAVCVVPGAVSAGVTAEVAGKPDTTARSGPLTERIDAHQYAAGAGPCLHALATGQIVSAGVAASRAQWPEFAAAAHADGITSFLAAPLTPDANAHIGVLNLYGTATHRFEPSDVGLTLLITDQVDRAVADFTRLDTAQHLATGLRTALSTRAVIEQAKGILMAVHHITDDAAFQMLSAESQRTNRKVHDLAAAFVADHTGA